MYASSRARLALWSEPTLTLFSEPAPKLFSLPASEPVRWTPEREASASLRRGLLLGVDQLLHLREKDDQQDGRTWAALRTEDAGMQARLLMFLIALGYDEGDRADRLADALISSQLPDGGWQREVGGSFDLSTTVLAYLAIKLHRGVAVLSALRTARRAIAAHGGATQVNSECRAWLALFGQIEASQDNQGKVWQPALAQGILRRFDPLHGVRELFTANDPECLPSEERPLPAAAELLWRRLGMPLESPDGEQLEREIEALIYDVPATDKIGLAIQPQREQDTAEAMVALVAAGRHGDAATAAAWLVDAVPHVLQEQQVTLAARVMLALCRWSQAEESPTEALPPRLRLVEIADDPPAPLTNELSDKIDAAVLQLASWLLSKQGAHGGWATTEKTALAVEALAAAGALVDSKTRSAIERGASHLRQLQLADGSWAEEGSGHHRELTAHAIRVLVAAGSEKESEPVLAAVNWLLAEQQEEGSWQSCVTMTSLALEALAAAGQPHADAVAKAATYLLEQQQSSGEWAAGHAGDEIFPLSMAIRSLAAWASASRRLPMAEPEFCLRVVGADTVAS